MLELDGPTRAAVWEELVRRMEQYTTSIDARRVTPELDPQIIREVLDAIDFNEPWAPVDAVHFAADALSRFQTHTPHPRYFGLFNPAPATMGIAADALVAAFNPQLAAWSHSPFAIEVEQHLIRAVGGQFGYDPGSTDGAFASGGMEANHTAVLTALAHQFPEYAERGTRALTGQPMLYVSSEAHHSFLKAARMSGIGMDAVRLIQVGTELRMDPAALNSAIASDRQQGCEPFLIVGTAGTTNSGAIDPLDELADIAEREHVWYHVDAAWGGAAVMVPELRPLLAGIERSDSITFDAHKWLSVPMGAGVYLTRHRDILERTFRVATAYMPREAAGLDVIDPHLHSMQWSRRFTGLKLFLTLLVAGWDGYAEAIRHQAAMGTKLAEKLAAAGWTIANDPVLPVICFSEPDRDSAWHHEVAMRVVSSGEAWISTTLLAGNRTVLRACITNYKTMPEHLDRLVDSLERARTGLKK